MTAVRHAIVDDLCQHLQASTPWFCDNLAALRSPSPPTSARMTPDEVESVIEREEASIASALATLARAGRLPDYKASDYGEPSALPNPGAHLPSPSLVEELCDQLEDNLSWPILDAYYLREWPNPRQNWDLAEAEKQRLAALFRQRLTRSRRLLRRCGWTDRASRATAHILEAADAENCQR